MVTHISFGFFFLVVKLMLWINLKVCIINWHGIGTKKKQEMPLNCGRHEPTQPVEPNEWVKHIHIHYTKYVGELFREKPKTGVLLLFVLFVFPFSYINSAQYFIVALVNSTPAHTLTANVFQEDIHFDFTTSRPDIPNSLIKPKYVAAEVFFLRALIRFALAAQHLLTPHVQCTYQTYLNKVPILIPSKISRWNY